MDCETSSGQNQSIGCVLAWVTMACDHEEKEEEKDAGLASLSRAWSSYGALSKFHPLVKPSLIEAQRSERSAGAP